MPTNDDSRVVLELDGRGRAGLRKLAGDHRYFFAQVDADGVITLTPAVVMTTTELALARNPELTAQIETALTDPSTLRTRDRISRPR